MMKRRWLLKHAALSLAGVLTVKYVQPFNATSSIPAQGSVDLLETKTASVFKDLDSARAVGREYLKNLNIAAADAQKFIAQARQSFGLENGRTTVASMTNSEFKSWIRERERQDFKTSQTVNLKGWVLSKTEAELCAVVALSEGARNITGGV